MRKIIYVVLMMVVMVGCTPPGPLSEGEGISPDSPAAARHPLSEGDGPAHTTSPRPSPGGEGVELPRPLGTPSQRGNCRTLEGIDSLMWKQPDSALKVMMEFAGSEAANGLDAFEGHYCFQAGEDTICAKSRTQKGHIPIKQCKNTQNFSNTQVFGR